MALRASGVFSQFSPLALELPGQMQIYHPHQSENRGLKYKISEIECDTRNDLETDADRSIVLWNLEHSKGSRTCHSF